uniref:Uncharacterized protein n=1 Tax=Parascaris univalens TaxID=6257 RepID=A0A915BLH8_PARUN
MACGQFIDKLVRKFERRISSGLQPAFGDVDRFVLVAPFLKPKYASAYCGRNEELNVSFFSHLEDLELGLEEKRGADM